MSSEALELGTRKVSDLKPNPNNLKLHPLSQIEQLVASFEKFGFNDPIGIDEDDNILEGHGRYEAALSAKLNEVPVVIVSGLNAEEKVAYAITHNQTTLNTGMDREAVRNEFQSLDVKEEDYMSVGYSADDVLFLSDVFDPSSDDEADHNGHATGRPSFLPPVVRTAIQFDNEAQFEQFQEFQMSLRRQYAEGATIADRLLLFVDEYGGQAGCAGQGSLCCPGCGRAGHAGDADRSRGPGRICRAPDRCCASAGDAEPERLHPGRI